MKYSVSTFVLPFGPREEIYDSEKLFQGFRLCAEGLGYSIVSDIRSFSMYDIDHNEYHVYVEAYVIKVPGLNITITKPTSYIEIQDAEIDGSSKG